MNKSRLEAFSDGVIAIIITIMVLELKIPDGTTWEAIKPTMPTLLSYILSFVFIGIYWGNHHHLLHTVKRVNSKIMWANLNLLFWLSLIPFATAWIGENNFGHLAMACYGGLLFMSGIAYYLLQKIIMKGYTGTSALIEALEKQEKKGIISSILYFSSIPLAFVSSALAGGIFIVVAILWLIPDKGIEKALEE